MIGVGGADSERHRRRRDDANRNCRSAGAGGRSASGCDRGAAYLCDLLAGTVVGSGTVSNENCREAGSSCIAERPDIEMIDDGEASTGLMRFGDRVQREAKLPDGTPLFGGIDQKMVKAG